MTFPVFREAVKRDADTIELFRVEDGPQRSGDPCAQGREDGRLVAGPQLRKYHTERGVLFVPTGDVRLPDRGEDRGHGSLEQRVVPVAVVGGFPEIEQHQHEEFSRAFGPLPLEAERPKKHPLGQKTVQLIRGPVPRGRLRTEL